MSFKKEDLQQLDDLVGKHYSEILEFQTSFYKTRPRLLSRKTFKDYITEWKKKESIEQIKARVADYPRWPWYMRFWHWLGIGSDNLYLKHQWIVYKKYEDQLGMDYEAQMKYWEHLWDENPPPLATQLVIDETSAYLPKMFARLLVRCKILFEKVTSAWGDIMKNRDLTNLTNKPGSTVWSVMSSILGMSGLLPNSVVEAKDSAPELKKPPVVDDHQDPVKNELFLHAQLCGFLQVPMDTPLEGLKKSLQKLINATHPHNQQIELTGNLLGSYQRLRQKVPQYHFCLGGLFSVYKEGIPSAPEQKEDAFKRKIKEAYELGAKDARESWLPIKNNKNDALFLNYVRVCGILGNRKSSATREQEVKERASVNSLAFPSVDELNATMKQLTADFALYTTKLTEEERRSGEYRLVEQVITEVTERMKTLQVGMKELGLEEMKGSTWVEASEIELAYRNGLNHGKHIVTWQKENSTLYPIVLKRQEKQISYSPEKKLMDDFILGCGFFDLEPKDTTPKKIWNNVKAYGKSFHPDKLGHTHEDDDRIVHDTPPEVFERTKAHYDAYYRSFLDSFRSLKDAKDEPVDTSKHFSDAEIKENLAEGKRYRESVEKTKVVLKKIPNDIIKTGEAERKTAESEKRAAEEKRKREESEKRAAKDKQERIELEKRIKELERERDQRLRAKAESQLENSEPVQQSEVKDAAAGAAPDGVSLSASPNLSKASGTGFQKPNTPLSPHRRMSHFQPGNTSENGVNNDKQKTPLSESPSTSPPV